jgi:Flp pilus assembly protein TadG
VTAAGSDDIGAACAPPSGIRSFRMPRWLRRGSLLVRDTRGVSAIEAAFAFPVLIAVMAGTFDVGRYYWVRNSMQLATEETGRYVMITGTTSQTSVQVYLQGKVEAVPSAQVNVNVAPSTSGGVSYLTITATYGFSPIFGDWLGGFGNRTITTRVKVPIVT